MRIVSRARASALLAVGLVQGCATITRGSEEAFVINTDPQGATATLSTGHVCETPCSLMVKRKLSFAVTIEKPCYQTVQTQVQSQVAGAGAAGMAGNVLLGGIIGAGVDAATGATKELVPNPLEVTLEPLEDCEEEE